MPNLDALQGREDGRQEQHVRDNALSREVTSKGNAGISKLGGIGTSIPRVDISNSSKSRYPRNYPENQESRLFSHGIDNSVALNFKKSTVLVELGFT